MSDVEFVVDVRVFFNARGRDTERNSNECSTLECRVSTKCLNTRHKYIKAAKQRIALVQERQSVKHKKIKRTLLAGSAYCAT